MVQRLSITVVMDNQAQSGLAAEHGLSLWVTADDRRIWYDFGPGAKTLDNARRLALPIEQADALVLSHGHYDHAGGLAQAMAAARTAPLFVHHDATLTRYCCKDSGTPPRRVGLSGEAKNLLEQEAARVRWTDSPTEIFQDIWVTGPVARAANGYERTQGFFLDEACRRLDPLTDDQALFIRTSKGTVVLTGCAHAGVINVLEYIKTLTPGARIRALIGGLHLGGVAPRSLRQTLAALRAYAIPIMAACHCTGEAAMAELRKNREATPCSAGTRLYLA